MPRPTTRRRRAEHAEKEKERADGNAVLALRKADDEKTARQEAERQLDRAKSFLFTAQLQRVAPIYETNPLEALALLEDANACPIDHRDVAWRFYERYCRRGVLVGLIVWV